MDHDKMEQEAMDFKECEEVRKELEDLLESEKSEGDEVDVKLIEKMLEILEEVCEHEHEGMEGAEDGDEKMSPKVAVMLKFSKKPLGDMESDLRDASEDAGY